MPKIWLRLELKTYDPKKYVTDPVLPATYSGKVLVNTGSGWREPKDGKDLQDVLMDLSEMDYELKEVKLLNRATRHTSAWVGLYELEYQKEVEAEVKPLSKDQVSAVVGGIWDKDPGNESLAELRKRSTSNFTYLSR
jgi:hypothetical protein